ncbi:MAG: PQQ-binding-like beta-propeller repeat protein [Bacteroidales bacterium]|jgi:outer membrane protein assembly factor BamB|nr:PQQ-binding-like beta-propeller repeat protein [Bacteroidales bacterium]
MIKKNFIGFLLTLIIFISISSFVWWFTYNPVKDLTASVPGLDNRPPRDESNEIVNIGERFDEYSTLSSNLTGKWTRFRGADYDNINKENIPLIDNWGDGPKIEWTVDLGEGHAAPVIYNGKVYILDYNELRKRDALRCFSLKTGEELWRRSYNVHVKRNHGMSRTVPAINEKYILTIGPRCHVMCTDPNNGDLLWGIDLVKEYNTEIPFWYTGQCPMIDGDLAILAPGGTSLIIAVDLATGKVVWETLNPDNWQMSHSSIMPMTLNGKKMYVYAAVGGICGISAEGDDRGKILWKTIDFSPTVVAPSPLILDNGNIFMTAGYGAGAILFNVAENNGAYSVKVIQKYIPKDGIGSEQQTPLLFNGRMFAILPKDAGGMRNQFVCCDPNDGKNILWTSGKEDRFGLGPYAIADGKFFILNDDGTLTIAKASTERFIFLDKAKIIDGMDAWGPLAFADGYLIMRDSKTMVCLNIMKD